MKTEVGLSKIPIRKMYSNEDHEHFQSMVDIKDKSMGYDVIASMGSPKEIPVKLDHLHFLPGQMSNIPLNVEENVNITTIIGPKARRPLQVSSPVLISGMSYGAVSKNVRIIISKTAGKLGMGFNTGEGGVTDEEKQFKDFMILQYSTGRFGLEEELIKSAAAIEVRFGQGAYPGKGSYLPSEKITPEVARIRGLEPGESAYSPAHHPDILSPEDLEKKILWLRKISMGVPIGAKIGCGNVEDDVEILTTAGVDFIALDGFGAATGATSSYVRDNVGIPIIAALPRAKKVLEDMDTDHISLIASGGLRNSADMARCLALGADAVYIGTAALIAMNCEQYRICYSGLCPTGVATQNQQLLKQLDIDEGNTKLERFLNTCNDEIAGLSRIMGRSDVKDLHKNDLVSINRETAILTGVKWINGKYIKHDK
jgi:glutamate synthase domain-containing protein 2